MVRTDAEPTGSRPVPALRRFTAPFEVLAERNFRLLWIGQLISLLGDQLFLVALPFVLLTGEHDARRLGVVLLCLGIARTVALIGGGSLSDRFRRRVVMIFSDVARLVVTGVLAAVVLVGDQPLPLIAALAALLGLAQGIFLPSSYSIVPDLVGEDRLVAANSMTSTQLNLSILIGPALGGALVVGTSAGVVLLIDAVTFGVSAVSLAMIRQRPAVPDRPAGDAAGDSAKDPVAAGSFGESAGSAGPVAAGGYRDFLRYVVQSRLLPFSLLVTLIVNLGYAGMVEIALPALARERFDNAPMAFGLLLTASGLGAIVGALSAGPLLARSGGALFALGAGVVEGASILLVPVLPGGGAWAALLLVGVVSALVNVFFVSSLQRTVPRAYLGRAMGLLILVASATTPISYGLIAALVTASGPTVAFTLAGCATIAAFGVGFLSREIRRLSLS